MTLGDVLREARHSTDNFEAWLRASKPELAAALASAAERDGTTAAGLSRESIAEFSESAADEDWLTLLTIVREAADPGTACLAAMVEWHLHRNTAIVEA